MSENKLMIRVRDVKKQYRLGQIGGGTLRGDLQSWWARKRGKEDPNTLIGTDQRLIGTTFMALNGVSFTVNKGEAVGIIGSNGAGKSTLPKLLTHVTAPTEGDIDLYGRVASMLEVGTGFHPEMTGRHLRCFMFRRYSLGIFFSSYFASCRSHRSRIDTAGFYW